MEKQKKTPGGSSSGCFPAACVFMAVKQAAGAPECWRAKAKTGASQSTSAYRYHFLGIRTHSCFKEEEKKLKITNWCNINVDGFEYVLLMLCLNI